MRTAWYTIAAIGSSESDDAQDVLPAAPTTSQPLSAIAAA